MRETEFGVFLKTLIFNSSEIVKTSSELFRTGSELISTSLELISTSSEQIFTIGRCRVKTEEKRELFSGHNFI